MFKDRTDAGKKLAAALKEREVEADTVLGIPRGALPVARPVADELDAALDIVVASKIGAPENPELAVGAVASDGSLWLNSGLVDRLNVSEAYIEPERKKEAETAREKVRRYRADRKPPAITDSRVVIVDDGIATGATARACLRQVHDAGAGSVVLVVPVGSPETIEQLRNDGEEVIALETPANFRAVGQFYQQFEQVTDEEAMAHLEES